MLNQITQNLNTQACSQNKINCGSNNRYVIKHKNINTHIGNVVQIIHFNNTIPSSLRTRQSTNKYEKSRRLSSRLLKRQPRSLLSIWLKVGWAIHYAPSRFW